MHPMMFPLVHCFFGFGVIPPFFIMQGVDFHGRSMKVSLLALFHAGTFMFTNVR